MRKSLFYFISSLIVVAMMAPGSFADEFAEDLENEADSEWAPDLAQRGGGAGPGEKPKRKLTQDQKEKLRQRHFLMTRYKHQGLGWLLGAGPAVAIGGLGAVSPLELQVYGGFRAEFRRSNLALEFEGGYNQNATPGPNLPDGSAIEAISSYRTTSYNLSLSYVDLFNKVDDYLIGVGYSYKMFTANLNEEWVAGSGISFSSNTDIFAMHSPFLSFGLVFPLYVRRTTLPCFCHASCIGGSLLGQGLEMSHRSYTFLAGELLARIYLNIPSGSASGAEYAALGPQLLLLGRLSFFSFD